MSAWLRRNENENRYLEDHVFDGFRIKIKRTPLKSTRCLEVNEEIEENLEILFSFSIIGFDFFSLLLILLEFIAKIKFLIEEFSSVLKVRNIIFLCLSFKKEKINYRLQIKPVYHLTRKRNFKIY